MPTRNRKQVIRNMRNLYVDKSVRVEGGSILMRTSMKGLELRVSIAVSG